MKTVRFLTPYVILSVILLFFGYLIDVVALSRVYQSNKPEWVIVSLKLCQYNKKNVIIDNQGKYEILINFDIKPIFNQDGNLERKNVSEYFIVDSFIIK